jgi:hypothetical protein
MLTDVSEVHAASIIRAIAMMMEAVRTSEMLVDIQLRRQYIPEDSELQNAELLIVEVAATYIYHSAFKG